MDAFDKLKLFVRFMGLRDALQERMDNPDGTALLKELITALDEVLTENQQLKAKLLWAGTRKHVNPYGDDL